MSARQEILDLVEGHFAESWPSKPFRPGVDPVPVSGKVFDADDVSGAGVAANLRGIAVEQQHVGATRVGAVGRRPEAALAVECGFGDARD